MWRKTIKHDFCMFYTLIKHGFLTNQSARRVLYIYVYIYIHIYIYIYIYILKTELRISGFQRFHWLAGHRLSAHIPVLPNMVNERVSK